MFWLLGIFGTLAAGGGVAALLGGGPAMLLAGSKLLGFLKKIPWQAYAIAALAGLIVFLVVSRSHWMERAHGDEVQLALICQDTRDAAGNPKLDCPNVRAQIRELGNSIAALKGALERQNAAVAALGAKTAEQQKLSAEAQKRAAQRATTAEASAQRLRESARHGPPPGAPCAPSKVLQEQWQ